MSVSVQHTIKGMDSSGLKLIYKITVSNAGNNFYFNLRLSDINLIAFRLLNILSPDAKDCFPSNSSYMDVEMSVRVIESLLVLLIFVKNTFLIFFNVIIII